MDVVYFFCESSCVRIPYFGYSKLLFHLVVSNGGTWDIRKANELFAIKKCKCLFSIFLCDF